MSLEMLVSKKRLIIMWICVLLLCLAAVIYGIAKGNKAQTAADSVQVQETVEQKNTLEQEVTKPEPVIEDEKPIIGQIESIEQSAEGMETVTEDIMPSLEIETGQASVGEVEQESVEKEGLSSLHVDGTRLCDEEGDLVQLRGISTHGIAWFPQYVNEEFFSELKEEWNADVVRLAMYTAENGGYCTDGNRDSLKQLVKDGVAYAIKHDLYVIIDWHILSDGNPNTYKEESKAFFEEMSAEYKDYPNVIYEICNEPNGGVGWKDIKTYAEEIIEVIRKNDKDNIIIVGTPNWSQYVDQAAADPITSSENIMYALHYYAATHKEDLRQKMVDAYKSGLPIFVTEYGICDASGNGAIDETQANAWVNTMNEYGISYVAWNLSNKNETSAVFKSSCDKSSGFSESDLSNSGKWVYQMLTGSTQIQLSDDTKRQEEISVEQQKNDGDSGTVIETFEQRTDNHCTGTGDLTTTTEIVDSWKGENGYCFNCSTSICNGTGTEVESWEVTLTYNNDIVAVQGWNGNFSIEGNKLHITSMDYNGWIGEGESVTGIGFIITGPADLSIISE